MILLKPEVEHLNSTVIGLYYTPNDDTTELIINCPDDSKLRTMDPNMVNMLKHNYFIMFEIDECSNFQFPENSSFLNHLELELLSVTSNNITKIFEETFSKLPEITFIDLSNNKISEIRSNTFANNSKLEKLIIDDNSLNKIDVDVFQDLDSFQELSMNSNRNFNFPVYDPFIDSKTIEIFSCCECGITHITLNTFSKMMNLKTLKLNKNKITFLSEKIFPKTLKHIYLDQNQIMKYQINSIYPNQISSIVTSIEDNAIIVIYKVLQNCGKDENGLENFEVVSYYISTYINGKPEMKNMLSIYV